MAKAYRSIQSRVRVGALGGNETARTLFEREFFDVPTVGLLKYWNGSAWVEKPLKYWNGTAWVAKPLKHWNGSAWVLA